MINRSEKILQKFNIDEAENFKGVKESEYLGELIKYGEKLPDDSGADFDTQWRYFTYLLEDHLSIQVFHKKGIKEQPLRHLSAALDIGKRSKGEISYYDHGSTFYATKYSESELKKKVKNLKKKFPEIEKISKDISKKLEIEMEPYNLQRDLYGDEYK